MGSSALGINVLLAAATCAGVLALFVASSERFIHWFIVPVYLCGVLIGTDTVKWIRGRVDMYDPVGIFGVLGFHFFFLAPLLLVQFENSVNSPIAPSDWREWIGKMACLNGAGLLFYLSSRRFWLNWQRGRRRQATWLADFRTALPVLVGLLLVTAAAQALVYARFGGLLGYVRSYVARSDDFRGMGWVFMISESFPILMMFGYALLAIKRTTAPSLAEIAFVLLGFFIVQMFFGGLRGSRSNTVWGVFWAAGILHLSVRRLPRWFFAAGGAVLVLFMYAYGFYKGYGTDAVQALMSSRVRAQMAENRNRTFSDLLVGDLARADIQALLLYRLSAPQSVSDYRLAMGKTYARAAVLMVPKGILSWRPPSKTKYGTEAQYGMGTYDPEVLESSHVYGLAGETMLNFGPWPVPLMFLVLGFAVGTVRRWLYTWKPDDVRRLLIPMLINACIVVLVGDSDNLVYFFLKSGTVPMLALLLISRRKLPRVRRPVLRAA